MSALIGYARVSTHDQDTGLQIDALKQAGCDRIYTEKASGSLAERPELQAALSYLRDGDTLVVWKLDRLGRSLRHLIDVIRDLDERGVGFKSLSENINTTTAGGKLVFHLFGALAEFERCLIKERTTAGLKAARARGRLGGRKPVVTPEKARIIKEMYDSREYTLQQIADTVGVSRMSVYRSLTKSNHPTQKKAA